MPHRGVHAYTHHHHPHCHDRDGEAWPDDMGPREAAAASWFYPAVYAWVSRVPAGRVVTYGQVAAVLGFPRNARAVGSAMALCIDGGVPWQRVINARGAVSVQGEHAATQRRLLEREGVVFEPNGCVDLERFGWDPDAEREVAAREARQRRRGRGAREGGARPRRPAGRRQRPGPAGGEGRVARVRRRRGEA